MRPDQTARKMRNSSATANPASADRAAIQRSRFRRFEKRKDLRRDGDR